MYRGGAGGATRALGYFPWAADFGRKGTCKEARAAGDEATLTAVCAAMP